MNTWFIENWYVIWGLIGAVIYFLLLRHVKSNPDNTISYYWNRFEYTLTLSGVSMAIIGLVLVFAQVLYPEISVFSILSSPLLISAILICAWFLSPALSKTMPIERKNIND